MLRTKNWTPPAHPPATTGDPIIRPVFDGRIKRGIILNKMHFELSPLIVWIAHWIVNTYSEFQVNIYSNNRDITKCHSFCETTTPNNDDAKAIAIPRFSPKIAKPARTAKKDKFLLDSDTSLVTAVTLSYENFSFYQRFKSFLWIMSFQH